MLILHFKSMFVEWQNYSTCRCPCCANVIMPGIVTLLPNIDFCWLMCVLYLENNYCVIPYIWQNSFLGKLQECVHFPSNNTVAKHGMLCKV